MGNKVLKEYIESLVEADYSSAFNRLTAAEKQGLTNRAMDQLKQHMGLKKEILQYLAETSNPEEIKALQEALAEVNAAIKIQNEILVALSQDLLPQPSPEKKRSVLNIPRPQGAN